MRLLKEGYFNDKDIQSDDLVSDIEQSSNSSLSSDFKMSIVFTFNLTTFKQNQTMFKDIYLRLTRILPYISFIADYNLLEAQGFASDSYNSSDNK